MEEKILNRAIQIAKTIKKIYLKIKEYQIEGKTNEEQKCLEELKFVLEAENDIYKQISFKDLKKYQRLLILKNIELIHFNYDDVIFNKTYFESLIRVYNRLVYKSEIDNYCGEFHLEPYQENISYSYFKNKIIKEMLYFLLQNLNNDIFKEIKLNLAFTFKDIENKFLKNEQKEVINFPSENEYAFASCIDLLVNDSVDRFAIDSFENYFLKMMEVPTENLDSRIFQTQKEVHDFYLRFLFFLIHNSHLKESYLFLLEQNASLFPDFGDLYKNCIKNINDDNFLKK